LDKNRKICIIGAGPAGLSAAYFLKEKGYSDVVVLEKNSYVGGMCWSENTYGMPTGMGAIAITPDYKNVIKLSKKFGLDLQPGPVNILIDKATGYQYPMKNLIREEKKVRLFLSILRYYYYLVKYHRSVGRPGFRKISKELSQPFQQWLEAKKLTCLKNLISIPVTCFGYGYLDEIPTLYVIKYLNFRNFSTLMYLGLADVLGLKPIWTKRLSNGLQNLMEVLAENVRNVLTDIDIKKITRANENEKPVRIEYFNRKISKRDEIRCDILILAFQQELRNMKFIDLSDTEKKLFGKVVHNNYYSIACEIKAFGEYYFLQLLNNRKIEMPEDGLPFMISKLQDDQDIAHFYSYSRKELTEKQICANMSKYVKMVNRKLIKILLFKQWDYFPHVSPVDLVNGFYDDLEALQGDLNTYYTGSLCNFELVENVMAYSKHIVNKYF
jgi:hypothetical protein